MNVKSARIVFGAALALYFLWVGSLIAMAVYSANRPPERIVRPSTLPGRSREAEAEAE